MVYFLTHTRKAEKNLIERKYIGICSTLEKAEGKENGVYIRIGATNRKADRENITELERQRANISFDEEINSDYEFSSLNLEPIKNL